MAVCETTIAFGGGTLQFSGSNATNYSVRFSNAASQAYSLDTNGRFVTLATGLMSSGGSPTKLGAGTKHVTITAVSEASAFLTIDLGGIFAIALVWMGKRMGVNMLSV